MPKDIFKSKKQGRPAGEHLASAKPSKEVVMRVAKKTYFAQRNTALALLAAKRKSEADEYYGSLGFDNPLKAADGEPSHEFYYGSTTHAHSRS